LLDENGVLKQKAETSDLEKAADAASEAQEKIKNDNQKLKKKSVGQ
jgi:hypothetical protein